MITARTTHHLLYATLGALAVALPLGWDATDRIEQPPVEGVVGAVERSSTPGLDEVELPGAIAFESLELDASCVRLQPAPGTPCKHCHDSPSDPPDQRWVYDTESFITYAGSSRSGRGIEDTRSRDDDGGMSRQAPRTALVGAFVLQ